MKIFAGKFFALLLFVGVLVLSGCGSQKKVTVARPQYSDTRNGQAKTLVAKAKGGDKAPKRRAADSGLGTKLASEARAWIGVPYKYGGESRRGVDCSGFVMTVYNDVAHVKLPRNSAEQCDFCKKVQRRDLQVGDLVFFTSSKRGGRVSHVGMYVGKGKMIHASTSKGVVESGLEEEYYKSHFHSAGRVQEFGQTQVAEVAAPVGQVKGQADTVEEMTLEEFIGANNKKNGAAKPEDVKSETVKPKEVKPEVAKGADPNTAKGKTKETNKSSTEYETDSVKKKDEIRETVVKAMKFGK